MKRFFVLALLCCLSVLRVARADTPEDQYVHTFNLIQEADALSATDAKQAMAKYAEAQESLQKIQKANPNWNPLVVNFRLEYVAGKLAELNSKVPAAPPAAPATNVPPPAVAQTPPAAAQTAPAAAAVTAPAPQPQKPAAPDDWQEQIGTLRDQVRQLEAERSNLQAKLKEAFAARPAETDPREMARLQDKVKELQKQNDLLKVTLDMRKSASTPAATPAPSPAPAPAQTQPELTELSRQLAAEKEQTARLALEKQALQTRLELLSTTNVAAAAHENGADAQRLKQLEAERDSLQKRLDEANKASVAHKGKAGEARLAELQLLLDTANARLAVYEARAVPYTPQELALLKTPAGKLSTTETDTGRKAIQELSPEAARLVAEARRQYQAGDLGKAQATYEQILHQEPNSVPVLADLASIELTAGNVEAAEHHVLQACKLAPGSAYALSVLGRVRLQQKQYDGAVDALARAAKLEPGNAEAQNFLGLALSYKGMRLQAENALRKALELQPNYAEAHNNLAFVYLTGKPPAVELARWHYQKALEAGSPHNPDLEKMLQASR